MILRIEKIGLSIEINDDLLDCLVEKGKKYYPDEFGGFLIGYYSEDGTHLHITDFILPQNFTTSKYNFERSSKGIESQLIDYYKEIPKKFYVGEWHTHPDNSVNPSTTDILAMKSIVSDKNTNLINPILLIIGYSRINVDFGFYVWFENKIYRYE